MIYRAGSQVTVQVSGIASTWSALDGIEVAAIGEIANTGWLHVLAKTFRMPSYLELIGSLDITSYPYSATLVLQVASGSNPVTDEDVSAVVIQAFTDAVGTPPTSVNAIGQAIPTSRDPNAPKDLWQQIADAFAALFSGVQGTVAMVVIAIVLIVVVLAPHAGKIAGALA